MKGAATAEPSNRFPAYYDVGDRGGLFYVCMRQSVPCNYQDIKKIENTHYSDILIFAD